MKSGHVRVKKKKKSKKYKPRKVTRLSKYIQNNATQKFLAYKQVTNCSGDNILIFTINELKN